MVGHQAIAQNGDAFLSTMMLENIEVERVIRLGEKHILATIAALGDVVGKAGRYNSCNSCHFFWLLIFLQFASLTACQHEDIIKYTVIIIMAEAED
jgi:hypothetical protein